ncbi:hypothetical protein FHS52_000424 [Erythromicrobium ramosum]|uniref:GDYXXLXY domain-containing protein n=1 Tax=Erythrobacter ramosus TaxID=35811 RepID=A0A6I4UKH3_9SPHN|nr:GDYXXLXY domain-containing protein [Erythrobacter ramosus]MBB3774481.1 hypothetical protein [Erythrobacter ramosus]MXP37869.1 hypothetical protein [Erythrobacter ramosus]
MNRLIRLAAVVVPVLGLGALWAQSDRTYHQGTEWEVPIQGYDPRDYLRGHYVEFSYDWPGFDARELDQQPEALCLAGKPPRLDAVVAAGDVAACTHPITPDSSGVYGIYALMTGRLYLGQDRAAQLEEQLRNGDQRGIVTIRQRDDGSFTPIGIRFRPLTPAEIAERDAQRAEESLPPPAIMSR